MRIETVAGSPFAHRYNGGRKCPHGLLNPCRKSLLTFYHRWDASTMEKGVRPTYASSLGSASAGLTAFSIAACSDVTGNG